MKRISFSLLMMLSFSFTFNVNAQQYPKAQKSVKDINAKQSKSIGPTPIVKAKEQKVEIITDYGRMVLKLYNETPMHRDNFIRLAEHGFYDSLLFHRIVNTFMIQGGDPESKNAPAGAQLGNGDIGYKIPEEFNKKLLHKRGALAAARDNNPEKASSGCQFYIVQGKQFTVEELNQLVNNVNYNAKAAMTNTIVNSDTVKAKIDDYKVRGDKEGMHNYLLAMQPRIDEIYKPFEFKLSSEQIQLYTTVGGSPHLDMNYTVFGELIEGFEVLDAISAVKTDKYSRPLSDIRMKVRLLK